MFYQTKMCDQLKFKYIFLLITIGTQFIFRRCSIHIGQEIIITLPTYRNEINEKKTLYLLHLETIKLTSQISPKPPRAAINFCSCRFNSPTRFPLIFFTIVPNGTYTNTPMISKLHSHSFTWIIICSADLPFLKFASPGSPLSAIYIFRIWFNDVTCRDAKRKTID